MSMFAQYFSQVKSIVTEENVSQEDNASNEDEGQGATENLDQNGGGEDITSKSENDDDKKDGGNDEDESDPLDMNQIDADLSQAEQDLTNEIKEDIEDRDNVDYDGDGDISSEIDQFSQEMEATETYFEVVGESMAAIAEHGLHPSTFVVLKATKLLSSTALESLGLETFEVSGPEDEQTKLALEAMESDLQKKHEGMVAKILGFVKNMGEKLMNTLGALWEKIKGGVKSIKETAKAHPYATVAAAVAAVAAVAGVVAYAGGNLPGMTAKPEVFKSFNTHMATLIEKIKWPFGKVKAMVSGDRLKAVVEKTKGMSEGVTSAATSALGWTSQKVSAIISLLGRAWTTIKNAIGAFGTRVGKHLSDFHTGINNSAKAVAYRGISDIKNNKFTVGSFVGYLFYMTAAASVYYKLLWNIVVGAFRLVANTFSAITGGSKAEA